MKILALGFSFLVLGLLSDPQLNGSPLFALEQITVSYQGPGILTLPFAVAMQQGFFQEQNLDVKLILTKSDVDHIALATGWHRFHSAGNWNDSRGRKRASNPYALCGNHEALLGPGGAPGGEFSQGAEGKSDGGFRISRQPPWDHPVDPQTTRFGPG